MKISIKLAKPRNPVAVAAKARRAGLHASDKPRRQHRRAEKRRLSLLLSGREIDGMDAL